jgi:aerobic C4-dicarboxylate transport protein
VSLIKMMISPIIFCTIVLGIGAIRQAATVGRVGLLALGYFLTMSTFALAIGLVVGNIVQPGAGLDIAGAPGYEAPEAESTGDFLLDIIPTTLFSPLVGESVLSTLFVAMLVGFAVQALGRSGEPILTGIRHIQRLVFRVLAMIMWVAPIGAFGAIAAVVGSTGVDALYALAQVMLAFYVTCLLFVLVVLGALLRFAAGINIFAIYLTMASLFIADALGRPMAIGEQIGLLVFMVVASKGAAGVSGAGLATLGGGLAAHRPDLVEGVGIIVGIDRFMSEARALTNFAGNAVATVLVGKWVGEFDRDRADRVLAGDDPFDEATMLDDEDDAPREDAPGDDRSVPVGPVGPVGQSPSPAEQSLAEQATSTSV